MVIQKLCENFMPRRFSFDFPHHEFPSMAAFNARHSPISKQVLLLIRFEWTATYECQQEVLASGLRIQDSGFRTQTPAFKWVCLRHQRQGLASIKHIQHIINNKQLCGHWPKGIPSEFGWKGCQVWGWWWGWPGDEQVLQIDVKDLGPRATRQFENG